MSAIVHEGLGDGVDWARAAIGELFSKPWLRDLMADLQRRQPRSLQRVAALREHSLSSSVFWPFFAITLPLCVERAEGGRLWDIDGNEYLDLFLGFGAQSLHGHNPEEVVRFVSELMGKSVGNGYCASLELEHARLLKEMVPHRERWLFQNSGSDATTAAIRLARAFSKRRLVVRFEGTINGQHDLTSYNAHPPFHGYPLLPFAPKQEGHVQLQSFSRGTQTVGDEDLLILSFHDPVSLEIIERRKHEIACVITEPIPMFFPFPDEAIGFARELESVCRRAGVLLVLDEITTGFRCGPSGVAGHAQLNPDLITYGKVLSALGLPLSAVAGRSDILELAATSGDILTDCGVKTLLATSHIGNHLAIAASYASLSLLRQKGSAFYERTRRKAQRLRDGVAKIDANPDRPLTLCGYGDFIGTLAFRRDEPAESIREFVQSVNPLAGAVLALLLRRKGIHFHGAPVLYTGDAHTEEELDTAITKIGEAVQEMKQNDFPF